MLVTDLGLRRELAPRALHEASEVVEAADDNDDDDDDDDDHGVGSVDSYFDLKIV